MRVDNLEFINKILTTENAKAIKEEDLLTNSELDSFGYAILFIELDEKFGGFDKEYLKDELMSNERVMEQLKIFLPQNALIRYIEEKKESYLKYSYIINILVKEPKEFFALVDSLNEELYSININYPINMIKKDNIIEIEFNLDFNQNLEN